MKLTAGVILSLSLLELFQCVPEIGSDDGSNAETKTLSSLSYKERFGFTDADGFKGGWHGHGAPRFKFPPNAIQQNPEDMAPVPRQQEAPDWSSDELPDSSLNNPPHTPHKTHSSSRINIFRLFRKSYVPKGSQ